MSSPTTLPVAQSLDWGPYRNLIPALGFGLVLLGFLFHTEIAAAIATWIDSTAYNHCFLILPISFYLAWDRRDELRGVPIATDLRLLGLAVPAVASWLLAERLGIMEGRQLMVILLVQVLFLAGLGWPMWKRLSGPLLYLFFLVPFGAFLTPALQDFTAGFTTTGLNLLGIPNYSDGNIIEIAQGVFYVAEACAGLRFLIASVAFGVLYALVMYRSPRRRAAFILVSIVTPIIANGFRALGIVVLGRYLGSAEAAGADHLIYGWVFFSFVILMLVLLGMPFREDGKRPEMSAFARPIPPIHARAALVAGILLVAMAAIGPAIASALDRSSRDAFAGVPGMLKDGACIVQPLESSPMLPVQDTITRRVRCGDQVMRVGVVRFAPGTGPALLIAEERRLLGYTPGSEVTRSWLRRPENEQGDRPPIWRLNEAEEPARTAISTLWIDGKPAQIGLRMRAKLALRSIIGGGSTPIMVTVTPENDRSEQGQAGRADARQAIDTFLRGQPSLESDLANFSRSTGIPVL